LKEVDVINQNDYTKITLLSFMFMHGAQCLHQQVLVN